jgi:tagatose-1,6-bisphosphate aldolase non-catalytic subunit AgaZ/GatZ
MDDEKIAEDERKAAAKAFGIQAAESGQVADAVVGRYNEIIAGTAENVEEGELEKLKGVMEKGLERANKTLEAHKKIYELTNRVAEALYNIG